MPEVTARFMAYLTKGRIGHSGIHSDPDTCAILDCYLGLAVFAETTKQTLGDLK